jgi:predicted DNA-binding mobile mystery protein A
MLSHKAVARRVLDRRLEGVRHCVGPRPLCGWIKAVRDALGMSTYELGSRLGVRAARVTQIERAEVAGTLRLASLERTAEALGCELCYALVPKEPLEQMVRRQAFAKAAAALGASTTHDVGGRADGEEEGALLADVMAEQLDALAHELIDRRGLWRADTRSEPS